MDFLLNALILTDTLFRNGTARVPRASRQVAEDDRQDGPSLPTNQHQDWSTRRPGIDIFIPCPYVRPFVTKYCDHNSSYTAGRIKLKLSGSFLLGNLVVHLTKFLTCTAHTQRYGRFRECIQLLVFTIFIITDFGNLYGYFTPIYYFRIL